MGLQKYRADVRKPATLNGAVQWCAQWQGGLPLAKVEACPCDDGRRRTAYVTGEPDTWFSVPAAVTIRGKRAVGYITATEGGPQFRFLDGTLDAFGLQRVILDDVTGNPPGWRLYGVAYGNGNDGLSRHWPDFQLWADPEHLWDVARLAMTTRRGLGSPAWVRRNVDVAEVGADAVQACIMDPPDDRTGAWSDANGAWRLVEVYPAAEISEASDAPIFMSPEAAFGRVAAAL